MRLKYLCSSFSNSLAQSAVKSEGQYKVYGASGLVGYLDKYEVAVPYLSIVKDGAGVGRVRKYESYTSLLSTLAYIVPNELANIDWLKYIIQSLDLGGDVDKTTIPHVYFSEYGNREIRYVSLDEQQRIAAFLDDKCARIDSIVEKTRASIVEYKKLKQAIITRAVTKGIRAAHPMKDSGIEWLGDIPADWEVIKLKYIFSIIGGNGFPDILQGNTSGDYPFCKVSDINGEGDYVETASNWVSQSVVDNNRFNIVPKGSIIMAKIGAALTKNHRKINLVNCCIDNNTQALVPKRKDFLRYLLYLSKCINMSWFDNNSTVPSVNNTKLLNFKVSIPPLDEQKEIAAYLDGKTAAIDSLIKKKGGLVTELESLKKSLIFEYVTGKKEAPT
ncbi:MAG: restriction endonuclease subunit S [Selenomonadaceae bacterium]|nr:restriction endonuclease subunit S [Selenomonadaceae bacterium]